MTGSLLLPLDQFYFSSVSASFAFYDPPSSVVQNTSATCTDSSMVSLLIAAFQRQSTSSSTLNLMISCGSYTWQVFLCSGRVTLCLDCDWQCACPAAASIITTCLSDRSCFGNHASFVVITFSYKYLAVAPAAAIISVRTSRLSAYIAVNMTSAGRLYCYAAPYNTSLYSAYLVRQNGQYTLVTDGRTLTAITLQGLSPNTYYDVYIYSEALSGLGMSLAQVRATKRTVKTLCCAGFSFLTKFPLLVEYTPVTESEVDSNVFLFSLDTMPVRALLANVSLVAVSCAGSAVSSSSKASAFPSTFTFSKGSSLTASFVVHGTVGCYILTVYSTGEYQVNNASVPITIYSHSAPRDDPVITSATFSADGTMLYILFDSPTNYGSGIVPSSSTVFDCSLLLSFTGAEYASCRWNSNRLLVATLDGERSPVSVGDIVALVASVIHPAIRLSSTSQTVTVQPPPNPASPVVSLSTAKTIGPCENIQLDGTSSSGSGGRHWVQMVWSVTGSGPAGSNASAIASYLNTYCNTTSSVAIIPRRLFTVGGTLTFTLLLQNFLGLTSVGSKTVSIASTLSLPQVKITGPGQIFLYRKNSLSLFAQASVSPCANATSLELSYSWRAYLDSSLVPSLVSTSRNDRTFFLPAYSLTVLERYTVQVTVTSSSTGSFNSDTVLVFVGRAGVFAQIAGGSLRTVSSLGRLVLDASQSYDLDYSTDKLQYSWSCFIVSPLYGSSCGNIATKNTSMLILQENTLNPSTTYNFSVVVSSSDGYSDLTSVAVKVVGEAVPYVEINTTASVFNANERNSLNAIVNASSSFYATWSCLNCNFNLSTITRSPLTLSFTRGLVSSRLSFIPTTAMAGLSYALMLSVTYGSSPTSTAATASITLYINGPPYGGLLSVSPQKGVALSTLFYLNTYNWVDVVSDYPLQYSMSYYAGSASVTSLVMSKSTLTYVNSYLGPGTVVVGYAVTCVASAYDIYGATANSTAIVTVSPALSLSQLQKAAYQQLKTAAATLNTDLTSAVVNTIALSVNQVNCTDAPNCNSLNRTSCSTVAHTCGPCKEGYLGAVGAANSPCESSSFLRGDGGTCIRDDECVSSSCLSGTCTVAPKECPANCTGAQHGSCISLDWNGARIPFCSANSDFCQVKCVCRSGWFGSDCSMDEDAYSKSVELRAQMCVSYFEAMQIQVF